MKRIHESDLVESLKNILNDVYPPIKFGSLEYLPGEVLESVDPIAFRQELLTYIDHELSEGRLFEDDNGDYWDEDPNQEDEDEREG